MNKVPVIGVVGGVGAGKSVISKHVAQHAPVEIIDGDIVGHEGLKQPEIKEKLVQAFGKDVLDSQGEVIRSYLGKLVFGNGSLQKINLQKLNQIIHPWMENRFEELLRKYQNEINLKAVIFDAAILLDAGWDRYCDKIVFIDVPQKTREKRVREQRAWSKVVHAEREASQLELIQKLKRADAVIVNKGDLKEAGDQFISYIDTLQI